MNDSISRQAAKEYFKKLCKKWNCTMLNIEDICKGLDRVDAKDNEEKEY